MDGGSVKGCNTRMEVQIDGCKDALAYGKTDERGTWMGEWVVELPNRNMRQGLTEQRVGQIARVDGSRCCTDEEMDYFTSKDYYS